MARSPSSRSLRRPSRVDALRAATRPLGRALRRRIRLSRLAIWVERLARALWPAFALACLGLATALIGGYAALGPLGHRVALGAVAAAVLIALGLGLARLRRPAEAEARARLDAGSPARPLAALTDRLAGGRGEASAQAIWRAHLRRAERAAAALRPAPPDLRLARWDRWALRLFAPALLVGALIGAGGDWQDRLVAAAAPAPIDAPRAAAPEAQAAAEAWARPPAYTGQETVFLNKRAAEGRPIDLPEGSEITLRVSGVGEAPRLDAAEATGLGGFAALGAGLYELVTTLGESTRFRVLVGETALADWQVNMIPDQPPEIEVTEPPGPSAIRALEVAFAARDDYGVVAAWAEIRLADPSSEGLPQDPIEFALPMPMAGDARAVTDTAVRNLTAHRWAGAEVVMTLRAEDAAGQVSATEPVRFTLPARRFFDPLARALAEQRREFVLDYGEGGRVLDVVQSITRRPAQIFEDHHGAFLGVRSAVRRLARGLVEERLARVAPEVIELFWRAALALEEGDMAEALERLRAAEARLREALESGTEEEIRAALDALREAMNEYLRQLAQQALDMPEQAQRPPNDRSLTQRDLEEMLNQLQRQAESGLRDQARDMLSELSRMLENLQPGGRQQAGQGAGEQALEQLRDMIQRQRDLADDTFDSMRESRRRGEAQGQRQGGQPGQRPSQRGQPNGRSGPAEGFQSGTHGENGRLAAEQEALRRAIEELRDQLGGGEGMSGASRALDEAGREMGEARDDLQDGATGEAVSDQMEALDRLDDGAEALAEAVQQGQGEAAARGDPRTGEGPAGDRRDRDPFDRPRGGYGRIDGTGVEVPDEELMNRARELMQELRRRSSERSRPELELDYLERLLERF